MLRYLPTSRIVVVALLSIIIIPMTNADESIVFPDSNEGSGDNSLDEGSGTQAVDYPDLTCEVPINCQRCPFFCKLLNG